MPEGIAPRAELLRTRDFIGRAVIDSGGDKVGTVADLLLDRRRGDVRMLDVDLGLFQRHVLVPAEQLDFGEEALVLRRWTRDQVKALPAYDPSRPLTLALLEEMERAHPTFYGNAEALPAAAGESGVVPLRDAKDFRLSKGAPDVRGWNVFGADGERIGTVAELLVDPAAMKIRYLDVDLLDDLFKLQEDRHVLVPLEAVDLRERGRDVWIRDLRAADVAQLPAYTGGAVSPIVEERVQALFGRHGEFAPRDTEV
jgi:sporulation protein YlmC with PRC-barrel domain